MNCLYKILLLFCFLPLQVHAFSLYSKDDISFTLQGSYKNLFFVSQHTTSGDAYVADLNRLRTEWEAKLGRHVAAKVVWDHEVIGGDYVNGEGFAARQFQRSEPYLDMDYEIVRRKNFFYGQALYRAYLKLDGGPATLVLGRQKVDWGVMRLFSPVDLFNELPLFHIEREERVGATAANLNLTIRQNLKINAVYDVNPDGDRSRVGARITQTVGHFDVSLLGGRFLRDGLIGFDFAGDVKKAGVRGELIYDITDVGDHFTQFAAGIDYGFENTLYVALEYFYNGQGGSFLSGGPTPFLPVGVRIQSVHKSFAGLLVKYDLTPLWKVFLQNIVDVGGGSAFVVPETKYSFYDWLDVLAGAQLPFGRSGGEFTAIPNTYYLQAQLFF